MFGGLNLYLVSWFTSKHRGSFLQAVTILYLKTASLNFQQTFNMVKYSEPFNEPEISKS